MACKTCRAKKIKCDRTRPVCQNCRQRASQCSYTGERRTRRWTEADAQTNRRLLTNVTYQPASPRPTAAGLSTTGSAQLADPGRLPLDWQHHVDSDSLAAFFAHMTRDSDAILQTPAGSSSGQDDSLLDRILDGDDLECLHDANPSLWVRMGDGDEYTGPSSGISTVSDLGLNWVRDKVPDSHLLCDTIQDIRNGILSHIRQPKCIPQNLPLALSTPYHTADLSHSQILQYVDAYFAHVQVVFPILDRDTFLSQLATMGDGSGAVQKSSWLALLNVVLASGCRASLSDETAEAFRVSGAEAWGYFRAALSYEPQIVHGATDLLAVQAMALMAVFAQGLSSPQRLEYTLSSAASRLAQSLGLDRNPPPEWNLTEDEKRERSRVFWAVYCLDKSIALRCGRPAVICDDQVNCRFPLGIDLVPPGSGATATAAGPDDRAVAMDFFRCFTKLARIGGDISRSLYSASALFMPVSRLVPTLNRLLQDLERWLESISPDIRPGRPLSKILARQGRMRDQVIVLHSSYYYVLCSIFRRGTPMFNQGNTSVEHLINQRSHISHMEAARSIILLTKHLDIESFTPAWYVSRIHPAIYYLAPLATCLVPSRALFIAQLCRRIRFAPFFADSFTRPNLPYDGRLIFYYPFTALTTIFIHVVSNPPDDRTQIDIALMETVVGFFGRLEYVTSSEAAFTKTTEFVRQARRVVESYHKRDNDGQKPPSSTSYENLTTSMGISLPECGVCPQEERPVDLPDIFAHDFSNGHDIMVPDLTGTGPLPAAGSPRREPDDEGDHLVSDVANPRDMSATHNSQSLYGGLAGFLAPTTENSIQVRW